MKRKLTGADGIHEEKKRRNIHRKKTSCSKAINPANELLKVEAKGKEKIVVSNDWIFGIIQIELSTLNLNNSQSPVLTIQMLLFPCILIVRMAVWRRQKGHSPVLEKHIWHVSSRGWCSEIRHWKNSSSVEYYVQIENFARQITFTGSLRSPRRPITVHSLFLS